MEMIEYMYQYYQSERSTAILAVAIGVVFLITSFLFFQYFGNYKLVKGLLYTLCGAGLFFLVTGVVVTIHNNRKMEEVALSPQTNFVLHQSEKARIQLVLTTGYRFSLILFSTLVVGGLSIILTFSNDLWKGIGLGLLIVGTVGHVMEDFSMQKNQAYQQKLDLVNF
ncbi:hypothetical protein [Flexithrix dorotheae]|uniref:hypothetical protein n=1 Tax=Flexithrix dorotheae TaxID=70993 RepID=UPI000367D554|nr:hypothetical protein [Flexithrix dorotheae]